NNADTYLKFSLTSFTRSAALLGKAAASPVTCPPMAPTVYNAYIATLEILYGNSTESLQTYSMYGAEGFSSTINTSLTDSFTPKRLSLTSPFQAKVVRVLPKMAKNLRLLRMELLGYPEDCDWLDT
uniref:F5/8 type C domain-containing protein n=1 Tax=Macrostomum lignano TaxID=282301 RepID=A0A1I8JEZ4_9PLAT